MTARAPGHGAEAIDLFRWACRLDVAARKAGNVSWASAGHRMSAGLFVASGDAAAPLLGQAGAPVGARIEAAVRASVGVAQCNTNLGILLLCAPLLAAAEALDHLPVGVPELQSALARVLQRLDVDDARAAYRAIALAHPGGLGQAADADVHDVPQIGLREAMCLAADRDQIAREYAEGFPAVFGTALPAFAAAPSVAWTPTRAMVQAYLALLASQPDSHIVRKHGEALAHTVMAEAQPWQRRAARGEAVDADPAYAAWDTSLKRRGINPGTSADLAVATAFVAALCLPLVRAAASPETG